jgi:hypothetical protein
MLPLPRLAEAPSRVLSRGGVLLVARAAARLVGPLLGSHRLHTLTAFVVPLLRIRVPTCLYPTSYEQLPPTRHSRCRLGPDLNPS